MRAALRANCRSGDWRERRHGDYPLAKPEVIRWLDPQPGLTATAPKRPSPDFVAQPPSPHGRGQESLLARVRTRPGFPSPLGRGWTATRAFASGRGTGEGFLSSERTFTSEDIPERKHMWKLQARSHLSKT